MEKIFYLLGKYTVGFYSFFAFKLDVVRQNNLPPGAKIFVANHPSTTDPFLSIILIKDKVRVLVSKRLFSAFIFGKYLKLAGHIPVDFENGKPAFESAKNALKNGESIVVFMEGDVSPQGSFHKPKTGAIRLSMETKAPIIPLSFSLDETKITNVTTKIDNEVLLAQWYTHGPYTITFGKPIKIKGNVENRDLVCSQTMMVMEEITKLCSEGKLRLDSNNHPVKLLPRLPNNYNFRYAFNLLNLALFICGTIYEKTLTLVEKYWS